jgi:hypothetical protein
VVLGDRIVYTVVLDPSGGATPSVWSQRLLDEPPVRLRDGVSSLAASTRNGFVWVVEREPNDRGGVRVLEIDAATGRPATTLDVGPGLRVAGVQADGLWLEGSNRIYTLSRAGQMRMVAVGSLVDASNAGALYHDCPPEVPCSYHIAARDGTLSRIVSTDELPVKHGPSPSVSPDGRWVLLDNGVFDRLTSKRLRHAFIVQSWAWSPDGSWLFLSTGSHGALAWNLLEERYVAVPVAISNATLSGVAGS